MADLFCTMGSKLADGSSSVILVSPKNEILLLHRVKTSTSFASAHVFPGGNLSTQDGSCPPPEDHARHEDSPSYRRAAIRELFEESGILLARERDSKKMLVVDEETREKGRRLIHQNQISFTEWLGQQHSAAEPDIGESIWSKSCSSLMMSGRPIDPIHPLDHTNQCAEEVHYTDVSLLHAPTSELGQKDTRGASG